MPPQPFPIKVTLDTIKATCASCSLHELCLPMGLSRDETAQFDQIVDKRRNYRKGQHLFRAGDPFQALFAVRTGFFKTFDLGSDGREKIIGFSMAGEMLGLDAISSEYYQYQTVALEDSAVCEVDFDDLERLIGAIPSLQRHFHKLMSGDISAGKKHMLLLDNTPAEERLAGFLLNLSQRFAARGYSPTHFYLRMTREDIGNYLGLTVETVSRLFTRLQQGGLISVHNKDVEIRDLTKLKELTGQWHGYTDSL